ncbi:MAG: ABC transporter ATP-binding protein [Chlorobium sp.]|jgi:peptide/nickel transport system ATP-binding protein|uniref:ABC transporter ATP-binding protein n=1 Tax=Chlorobium sp. TaxID=1095 RepID=UPI0025C33E5F|nr:ABC transporter ATP-binding protein [Chlorobium sp.]MCF8217015.1 ABC transporter ATP-binding protein [Chlorobium sp.]MCF8271845.1 ABC transporter ATP-binding protein [Chlorobium sp.]MCF8288232.1 ABC transporter ATP-binding protein [Chlorobium sp.]MCF8291819.1 ABC transporter ATP-binding protein [Chlorobium sp.]MCF8385915.1 ABC transporter ATP-binding protein [Chlorobium sp.]
MHILELNNLKTYYKTGYGVAKAVDGVSLTLAENRTLGIVGESGCGKSVTALSIMRLVPMPPGYFAGGEIFWKGNNILKLPEEGMQRIRGNEIAMIFQEPMSSLNPVFTCGSQITEQILLHRSMSRQEVRERAVELLHLVGIPDPSERFASYPHELSGGMRQRVMIAMALSCNPGLLIADEPTTALDVTVQAQILDLIGKLQSDTGMSVMLITHDFGVIAELCEEVIVMYASGIVEKAAVRQIFSNPLHPYTRGLLRSIPRPGSRNERLHVIDGNVPSAARLPEGCRFAGRCPLADHRCRMERPILVEYEPGHEAACWKAGERFSGE